MRGQDPFLSVPRQERGWPSASPPHHTSLTPSLTATALVCVAGYEEKMATVFKAAPPTEAFWLEGDLVNAWSKVIEAGGEGGEQKQLPPMAPSAFEALLETLTFTNG